MAQTTAKKSPHLIDESLIYTLSNMGLTTVGERFYIAREKEYGFCLLHYVVQGSGLLIVGGQEFPLSAGDLFLLRPGEPHVYASRSNDLELLWVEFSGGDSIRLCGSVLRLGGRVLPAAFSARAADSMTALLHAVQSPEPADPWEISALLYRILCVTLRGCEERINSGSHKYTSEAVEKSLQYLRRNLSLPLTVKELAREAGYHPQYFTKLFAREMGVHPSQYIRMAKIEAALQLLGEERWTARQLAERLGFCDTSHFSKCFRQYTGMSLRDYKTIL